MLKVSDSVRVGGSQLILCIPNPFSMMVTLLAFAYILRTIGLNIPRIHLQREFQFLKQSGLEWTLGSHSYPSEIFSAISVYHGYQAGLYRVPGHKSLFFFFFKEFSFFKNIDVLFWLRWVFVAVHWLSLDALRRPLWQLLFFWSRGSRAHRLW